MQTLTAQPTIAQTGTMEIVELAPTGLLRGVAFGIAIQTALLGAALSSWMMLRHL